MAKEKEMTMQSPEFQKVRECADELGPMMCRYLADHSLNVAHGLAVMAAGTVTVIESLAQVIGEDPTQMLETYVEGLREGFKEDLRTKISRVPGAGRKL